MDTCTSDGISTTAGETLDLNSTPLATSEISDNTNQIESKPSSSSIFSLFFGKINQILKIDNEERSKIFNNKTEKMGPVMLDVNNFSNLYDAWNAQCVEEINDFNCSEVAQSFFQSPNKSTEQPRCIKETWIQQLPKVLMFTLKRVYYDPKN